MKTKAFFIFLIFVCFKSFAQTPSGFNYQGIARDAAGNELANANLEVRLSIRTGTMEGAIEWQEDHSVTTNNFGLYNLVVGEGSTTGAGSLSNFTDIPWGNASHFLKVEINFGTGYLDMGTIQLLSVPYSFVSENVVNNDDADADPANEIQVLSISNDTIYLTNGGLLKLPAGFSGSYNDLSDVPANLDTDQTDDFSGDYNDLANQPANVSEFTNDAGYITSPIDDDNNSTNEIQILSISNDTIYLSNGGLVKLPAGFSGSYNDLSNVPANLDTDLTDDFSGDYNDLTNQPANVSDFTNDAGYITSPIDDDNNSTNEIQILSISNDTIYLTNGGLVKLPAGFSGSYNDLSNIPVNLDTDLTDDFSGNYNDLTNQPANVSEFTNDAGYITSPIDDDNNSTNEIQILSISNDTIYLSNGGLVKLPTGFSGSYNDLSNVPANLDIDLTDDFSGDYTDLINLPANVSDFANDAGYITSPIDDDNNSTNEIQILSISNDTIYLSDGGLVKLPDNDDADADPGNELQALSISNDTVFLANGGFVKLPDNNDADADASNEIQVLSTSNDTIYLSNGGYAVLPSSFYDNQFKIINASNAADNPTGACNVALSGPSGLVDNGVHDYKTTFISSGGETGTGPASSSVTVTDNGSNGQILITNIPTSGDASVTGRKIYRRFNTTGDYLLVTTLNDNSTTFFIDNIDNASLGMAAPAENATARSVSFDAAHLTENRSLTIPDISGTIVVDTGNVTIQNIADLSIIYHGKNVISQIMNGFYVFDASAKEWGEAYSDANGNRNSVEVNILDKDKCIHLSSNQTYRPNITFTNSDITHNPSSLSDPEIFFDENDTTYVHQNYGIGTYSTQLGKTFSEKYIDLIFYKISFKRYSGAEATLTITLQTYNGSTWGNAKTVVNSQIAGVNTYTYAGVHFYSALTQGIRLNITGTGGNSSGSDHYYYYLRYNTTTAPPFSEIIHNITAGTFSSTISSTIGIPLIRDWEEGANIQYKLTNDTEDSGWLDYNVVSSFTPFTGEPTKVVVRLIPKADNPTIGVPAIYGFYVSEF